MWLTEEYDYGTLLRQPGVLVGFGSRHSSYERLQLEIPMVQSWSRLKQVHGENIFMATGTAEPPIGEPPTADAQWTLKPNIALGIATADCMPVMIWDAQQLKIAAIHSGWKGVALNIVPKTIQTLIADGSRSEDLQILVGPHIMQSSFEVDEDVKNQILSSLPASQARHTSEALPDLFFSQGSKYYINLLRVVTEQLHLLRIKPSQIVSLPKNTKTDQSYHSFRRDRSASGRQISFIAMIKPDSSN